MAYVSVNVRLDILAGADYGDVGGPVPDSLGHASADVAACRLGPVAVAGTVSRWPESSRRPSGEPD